jgi:hypothetical protein
MPDFPSEEDKNRAFIEYFEKLYGRKPTPADALEGESLKRIAQHMGISYKAAKFAILRTTRPPHSMPPGKF